MAKQNQKEKGFKLTWKHKIMKILNNIRLLMTQSYLLMQKTVHIKWLVGKRKVYLKKIRHRQAQKSDYKVIIVKRRYQMM